MGDKRPTLRESIGKIASYLDEIKNYASFRQQFISDYDDLHRKYQNTKMQYKEFQEKLNKLLSGRTRQDWIAYYDSSIYLLYKKIDFYTDVVKQIISNEVIDEFYIEPEYIQQSFLQLAKEDQKKLEERATAKLKQEGVFTPHEKKSYLEIIERAKTGATKKYDLSTLKEIEEMARAPRGLEAGVSKETQDLVAKRRRQIQKGRTNINIEDFTSEVNFDEAAAASVEVKSFWTTGFGKFLKMIFGEKIGRQSFLSKDVSIGTSLLTQERLTRISKENYYEKSQVDLNILTKESIKLRNILRGKQSVKRKTFVFGTIANIMVRNISTFLIKKFPGFFEVLYNGLRLANVKMLSNTYVNVMVFSCILSLILGFIISFAVFASLSLPFFVVSVRALVFSLISGIITFAIFYGYPFNRIKERRRNIKTNLSFAISHMAAVSGSGVPPFLMFQLLAQSPEYGEVTIEIQRIVDYCNLFGYDLLISIKSVVATTPSPDLKEFLSGLVSAIESGGELKKYMIEKSKDAFTSYEIERQKFNQVISTYSDIYTGILIAAPLFFVSALSLVGMLGGQIGGLNVKFLIGAGIYFIIPVMNIGFIIFLEMTQPEI